MNLKCTKVPQFKKSMNTSKNMTKRMGLNTRDTTKEERGQEGIVFGKHFNMSQGEQTPGKSTY